MGGPLLCESEAVGTRDLTGPDSQEDTESINEMFLCLDEKLKENEDCTGLDTSREDGEACEKGGQEGKSWGLVARRAGSVGSYVGGWGRVDAGEGAWAVEVGRIKYGE